LGMVVGLVPKDNLTAAVLGMLLLTVRINLAAGTCTALVCACLAAACDPFTDRLGFALLTLPELTRFWNWLFQCPAATWTGLNNTVVVGSLALGCGSCIPRISSPAAVSCGSRSVTERAWPNDSKSIGCTRPCWAADLSTSWSWER